METAILDKLSLMAQFSFDIVSEYDHAEMNNVFDQARREIASRYDFKGTPATLEWEGSGKTSFKVTGNGEYQIEAIIDIIRRKLSARNISQKVLDISQPMTVANLQTSKLLPLKRGLTSEIKKISKIIRDAFPKVKPVIQADTVRVSGSNKDELQAVILLLKQQKLDFPLDFTNFR